MHKNVGRTVKSFLSALSGNVDKTLKSFLPALSSVLITVNAPVFNSLYITFTVLKAKQTALIIKV